jgi:hypothetical protein
MREIASDFPHANSVVPSATACWQAVADGTLKRGQIRDPILMHLSSPPARAGGRAIQERLSSGIRGLSIM